MRYSHPPPNFRAIAFAAFVGLVGLSSPAAAQSAQLVIPAITGTNACTQGSSEIRPEEFTLGTPTANSLGFTLPAITREEVRTWESAPQLLTRTVNVGIQEGGKGLPKQRTSVSVSGTPSTQQSITYSSLKKNTRYTVIVYGNLYTSPYIRRCFKTRGEFSPAEQNLNSEGSADLTKFGRTGCFAVARTRQDIADCMCNGTRGGTRILAGQTTGSQEARRRWGCPDLSS